MGVVYLAEQTAPVRRRVALKMIRGGPAAPRAQARFEAERHAMARLQHPAIAQLFDAGATPEGDPWFAMELVEGEPITEYCDRCRLGLRGRIELFRSVCEGVQHAHEKGLLHRDLKPANILVAEVKGRPIPKILDFGIAKATDRPLVEGTLSLEGNLVGTPAYLAPEILEATDAGSEADTRSDVYSLGVLLYELLVGVRPFETGGLAFLRVLKKIVEEEPTGPRARWGDLDEETRSRIASDRSLDDVVLLRRLRGDLEWIVLKAIARERDRRYASPAHLAADLDRHLRDEPVEAGPPTWTYRLGKFVRRRRGAVVTAGLVVGSLVLGLTGTLVNLGRAREEARRASREARRAAEEAEAARRALEEADEISVFLQELFEVSDPGQARGETITARELLDRGAERLRTKLVDRPVSRARLLGTIGRVYTRLGLYHDADDLLQEALAAREASLGGDDPGVGEVSADLAWLAYLRRRDEEAERFGLRALEIFEAAAEPDLGKIAGVLDCLGLVYWAQGRNDEAEPLLRRALDLSERSSGRDSQKMASSLTNLGVLCFSEGRWDEAEELYLRALEIEERELGPDHPDVALSHNNLAAVYLRQDRLDEAEDAFRRALAVSEKTLGPEHPNVGMARGNLGGLLVETGQFEQAEEFLRSSLAIYEANFEPDHLWLAYPLTSLGDLAHREGRLDDAEGYYRRALAIREDLPPDDGDLGVTIDGYAELLRARGRDAEAQRLEERRSSSTDS